jgi:tetratricopeptide (TPR) repeat protein
VTRSAIIARLWVIFCILIVLSASSCSNGDADRLLALAPDVDPSLARALAAEDPGRLQQYAADVGISVLLNANRQLTYVIQSLLVNEHQSFDSPDVQFLYENRCRLGDVLIDVFDYRYVRYQCEFDFSVHPDTLREFMHIAGLVGIVRDDTALTVPEKILRLENVLARITPFGDAATIGQAKMSLSELLAYTGEQERQIAYLLSAIGDCLTSGNAGSLCQIYGVLGDLYEKQGRVDSMVYYYNKGLAVAHRHRMPYQAARLTSFYAGHYREQGRLTLTYTLLNEALAICRKYKGGYMEFRYVMSLIDFYIRLGCWDVVDRLLQRAKILHQQTPLGVQEDWVESLRDMQLHSVTARSLLRKGRIDEADAMFKRAVADAKSLARSIHYAGVHYFWAKDLLEYATAADAIPNIRLGMSRAQEPNIRYLAAQFRLLLAEALFRQGDTDAASLALDEFVLLSVGSQRKLRRDWVSHDVLKIKIDRRLGRQEHARVSLDSAFARVEAHVSRQEASSHNYLWLSSCDELRQVAHDLHAGDPVAGYGVELIWYDMFTRIGQDRRASELAIGREPPNPPTAVPSVSDDALTRAAAAVGDLPQDATHLVYVIRDGTVWRFAANASGVRRDELSVSTEALRERVATSWAAMATAPAKPRAPIPAELVHELNALGSILLPREVRDAHRAGTGRCYVTADGFLGMIPFEVLGVSDGEYRPLLASADVVYVRGVRPRTPDDQRTRVLALSAPDISDATRRRLGLEAKIPAAGEETKTVEDYFRDALILSRDRATKAALLQEWERSSTIFLAAHFLQNPDVPYLTMLPLAESLPGAGPEANTIEVADIRRADLSRCDLVVLSGCSTGAPYVRGVNPGPSIADAFVDAGARRVIQTFWNVADIDARDTVSEFIGRWQTAGASPSRALAQVRRSRMSGPSGLFHPHYWAGFSIKQCEF